MLKIDWGFYNWWHNVYRAEPQEYIGISHWKEYQNYLKREEEKNVNVISETQTNVN